jgi:hypothetical protein
MFRSEIDKYKILLQRCKENIDKYKILLQRCKENL